MLRPLTDAIPDYVQYMMLQETLLNLLLRNYLHYNLYDQAEKLRSKAPRFEAHSNQQVTAIFFCILLYYVAHIVWNLLHIIYVVLSDMSLKLISGTFCFPLVLFCPCYTLALKVLLC